MKIFLSSDMEGTAGVVDWEQCVGDGPQAAAGRRLLLDEVNAAIGGAIAGGATEIVVNDSHSQMRNLPPQALDGQASYISGSHKPLYMMQGLDGSFGAALFVSYHGSVAPRPGCRTRTTPARSARSGCNGTVTGEARHQRTGGRAPRVPVVLGDPGPVRLRGDRGLLPGIHTAVVKEPVSRLAAHSLHPGRACALIREVAEKAVATAPGRAAAARAGRPPWRSRSAPRTSPRPPPGSAASSGRAPGSS